MDLSRRGFLSGSLKGGVVATAGAGLLREHPAAAETTEERTGEYAETLDVTFTVNGAPSSISVDADTDALEVIRERLGLTGSKRSCGHGSCGACTVRVDGAPTASCLLPATALQGRAVTTIEGIGEGISGGIHPMQRAFMVNDALQCGFCTPGFVVEATAFMDAWRAENGTERPDRDTIAAAMAGHLCRCGAYEAIYAAIAQACMGAFDEAPAPGTFTGRADALEKVTGRARYTVDVRLEGQLEGRVLRATHAHGVLQSLDLSAASAMPGVRAVVALVEPGRKIRFAGQELAAVAATTRAEADAALDAITVQIDPLPPVLGMDAARADDAPAVFAERSTKRTVHNASEGPNMPAPWKGNVRGPLNTSMMGKPAGAERTIAASHTVISQTWTTHVQCHTALEPHAAVAHWTGEKTLEVHLSTQGCNWVADDIAQRWGLRLTDLTLHAPYVGGGFGAKATLQQEAVIAIDLAREAGAPVRVALDRDEELTVGGLRPATEIELTVGLDRDGRLRAMQAVSHSDGGAAIGGAIGALLRLMYVCDHKDFIDYDVITTAPLGRPFRAPGGPSAQFALEQTADIAAERLHIDPIALRRKWDPNPQRRRLYDWAEALPIWQDRATHAAADRGRFRRGVGLAAGGWFTLHEAGTQVQLEVGPDGLIATSACQDMGNGSRTVVSWTVAEAFGLSPDAVEVRFGNSQWVHGCLSGGSRTTGSIGPAAADAAGKLQEALALSLAEARGLGEAIPTPEGLHHSGGLISWAEALSEARAQGERITVVGRRGRDPGGYLLPVALAGIKVGKDFPGTLMLSHVEVDARLGRIRVLEAWMGVGAGRIVVPPLARSQVQGGIIQGISFALYEDRRLDPHTGRTLTAGLEDYRIAGIGDVPPINVHFDEAGFEGVLGRAAGLAEAATVPAAGCIANAVHHATGWRPTALPLRPDVVLGGLS